jgi:tetratricopeptide (TPR) repeat protein
MSRAGVDAIKLYTEKNDAAGARAGLSRLIEKDPNNFDLNSWLGYICLVSGDPTAAVGPLKVARQQKPDHMANLLNLANAYIALNDTANAIEVEEARRALAPEDASIDARLGSLYLEAGNPAKAAERLETAAAAVPGDRSVLVNLAKAYTMLDDRDKAAGAYQRLLATDPDTPVRVNALSWIGFYRLQSGDNNGAAEALEEAHKLNENDLEILNNLGTAYSRAGRDEDAIRVYTRMSELNPAFYEPWYNLGVLYLKKGDGAMAVRMNQQAIERKSDEPFAHNNLGRGHELTGDWAAAAKAYARAAEIEPENVIFQRNAAVAAHKAGDERAFVRFAERALNLGENDPDLRLMLALNYSNAGKDAEAIGLLGGLEGRVTDKADYWYNLGVLKERVGDKDGAEAAYRRSLQIRPNDPATNQNLGLMLWKRGEAGAAMPHFEVVMRSRPNDVEAMLNVAAASYQSGKTDRAIELWRQVVRGNPERTDVRLNLADALWGKGDHEGARFHYAESVKRQPKNPGALNGVGLWQLRQSENKEAEQSFRRAIAADRNYLPAYNNLAVTLERLNRRADAVRVLEDALKIDPNFEDARKNLQRMKTSG